MSGLKSSYQHFILFYKCILNRKEKKKSNRFKGNKHGNEIMESSWRSIQHEKSKVFYDIQYFSGSIKIYPCSHPEQTTIN